MDTILILVSGSSLSSKECGRRGRYPKDSDRENENPSVGGEVCVSKRAGANLSVKAASKGAETRETWRQASSRNLLAPHRMYQLRERVGASHPPSAGMCAQHSSSIHRRLHAVFRAQQRIAAQQHRTRLLLDARDQGSVLGEGARISLLHTTPQRGLKVIVGRRAMLGPLIQRKPGARAAH